jgi:hypothetical protein
VLAAVAATPAGTAGAAGAELDELELVEVDVELLDTELEELLLETGGKEELLDTELDELLDVELEVRLDDEELLKVEELLDSELVSSSLPLQPARTSDRQVAAIKPRVASRNGWCTNISLNSGARAWAGFPACQHDRARPRVHRSVSKRLQSN